MSLSNSTFLFNIKVQDLLSYIECKNFYVRCQFADIFDVHLRDPNNIETLFPKKKKKLKAKIKETPKTKILQKHKTSQSILFNSSINSLIENMRHFPIELSLWGTDDTENKVGSTRIPWSIIYYEYLNKLTSKENVHPAFVSGGYNVFDEATSKRMAIIRLNVKLTYIKDKTSRSFQELFEDKQNSIQYAEFDSQNNVLPNSRLQNKIGVIKTSYSEGKRKKQQFRKSKNNSESYNKVTQELFNNYDNLKNDSDSVVDNKTDKDKWCACDTSLKVKKSRSDTDLNITKHFDLRKGISHCMLNRDRFNMLNYIYGTNGPFGNNTYYVGYFTVENDKPPTSSIKSEKIQTTGPGQTESKSKTPSSSNKNTNDEEIYKFRVCKSGCMSQTPGEVTCSQSHCSLDVPQAAADYITVKECTQIVCGGRKFNEAPSPPDDRVLLDLTHLYDHDCGQKKIEEISGALKAQQSVEMNEGSCFCTCECTFGFVKRTTYCKVCGGFEKIGEDYSTKSPNVPFPCPIYHKMQKAKAPPKIDPERDSKKKKKKKDDRFKFNYGYTGIPPQIGHSQCAMPCTGTLGNVPKNMGWLWTADNIPGLKVAQGWKPGAVKKQLLRKLNQAKLLQITDNQTQPTRKTKKEMEEKPTLIVCKRNGEYIVQMQATTENNNCDPLIYKIASKGNEDRIRARERKEKRLIKETVEEVWSDSYNPGACDAVCYKPYQQVFGIFPDDPYFEVRRPETIFPINSSETSSYEDASIKTDSSLDVDWEIHFTPPVCITNRKK